MTLPVVWAILVAGGSGQRYSPLQSKLLEPIAGKPVIVRSMEALVAVPNMCGVSIVYHPQWEEAYRECLEPFQYQLPLIWVIGGETRRGSVMQGLQVMPSTVNAVIVHDAARPLVKPKHIEAALAPILAGEAVGASLGVPCQNTVKQVAPGDPPWVEMTLDRERLWQVHTPQVFRPEILFKAHCHIDETLPIRDDAELVERYFEGQPVVRMVLDDPSNIKITTAADRRLAEALLQLDQGTAS